MKRALCLLVLLAGCDKPAAVAPVVVAPAELPFQELGAFEYREKMALPEAATRWNGKLVRATGIINPGRQMRDLKHFYLVKDRASCCFGARPQLNHYIDVTLKPGLTTHALPDPITVQGVLVVEERFDGDWPTGLFWMKDAEVVK